MECSDKSTRRGTPAGPLPLSGRYVLRAACWAQYVACSTNVTCPKGTTNLSVCLSAQLLFSCGMPLIVMDLYQNLIMSNISLVNAAAQPRLSDVCPFGETTVPLSCCPVCHRASRSCGCQTKLAKKLLPLPLPLPQPQPLPLPLPSATS